jgi:hypothetical protein
VNDSALGSWLILVVSALIMAGLAATYDPRLGLMALAATGVLVGLVGLSRQTSGSQQTEN